MVLTPEDVISKTFQPTRFAEGYNQDEVDEFLDDVVSTLRALHGQIEELESRLKENPERSESGAASEPPLAQPAVEQTLVKTDANLRAPSNTESAEQDGSTPSRVEPVGDVDSHDLDPRGIDRDRVGDDEGESLDGEVAGAAGVLVLAQRLHDEHVRNGRRQRDELVAEARGRAESIVQEAEETRTSTLSTLELERGQLQEYIDSLREHEQEYRTRLRSLLETQLAGLENQQPLEPAAAATETVES